MANSRLCSIPECGKKYLARGYCNAHYARLKAHGTPLGDVKVISRTKREAGAKCEVPDCDKTARRKGLCSAHHTRWLRHGDPQVGRTSIGEPMRFLREEVLTYDGDDCLLWPHARGGRGYGTVRIDGTWQYVHRIVCEDANGPPPSPEHEVAHSCGQGHGGCVTKRHVSWKTHVENEADKLGHGTRLRGSKIHNAKLTEDQAMEILSLNGSMTKATIARRFGVSRSAVSLIHSGVNWGWLPKGAS